MDVDQSGSERISPRWLMSCTEMKSRIHDGFAIFVIRQLFHTTRIAPDDGSLLGKRPGLERGKVFGRRKPLPKIVVDEMTKVFFHGDLSSSRCITSRIVTQPFLSVR